MKISDIFCVQNFNVVICNFFYDQTKNKNPKELLDILTKNSDEVYIQIVNDSMAINEEYIKEVLKISIESYKRGILATKKIETDLLMRLTHCDQIVQAIAIGGIKGDSGNYIIIFSKNRTKVKESIEKIRRIITNYEIKSKVKHRAHQIKPKSKDLQHYIEKAALIHGNNK